MPPAKVSQDDQNFNILFVAEVKKYACLYDSTSQEYKCAANQDKAWLKVGEAVNDSPDSCKKKWRNLRCCVTRYLKGLRENGMQRKPYYLFDHMKFVIPFLKTKSDSDTTIIDNTDNTSDTKMENITKQEHESEEYSEVEIDFSDTNLKENILNSIKVLPVVSGDSHQHLTADQYEIFEMSPPPSKKFCSVSSSPAYKQHDQQNQTQPQQQATSSLNTPVLQHQIVLPSQQQCSQNQATSANSVIIKEADNNFFKSLLPDIQEMNNDQKRKLKIGILKLIDDILSS